MSHRMTRRRFIKTSGRSLITGGTVIAGMTATSGSAAVLGANDKISLAFIGCGPVPSTLILLNHLAGIKGVGLDLSDEAVDLSRQVIVRLGLESEIEIVKGDETMLAEMPWDAILVAAMAMPKDRIFRNLRRIMIEKGKTDARVFYRTYTGMRAILHAPVTDDETKGFTIVGRFFPMGRVNNTVVVTRLEA